MLRSLTVLFIATVLTLAFAQTTLAETPSRGEFENSCSESCTAKGKDVDYCVTYCTCMTREIFLGRPSGEVDKLHAAMQPQAPESNEKAILKLLVRQCVGEAKAL